jgi:acyl dehydratase
MDERDVVQARRSVGVTHHGAQVVVTDSEILRFSEAVTPWGMEPSAVAPITFSIVPIFDVFAQTAMGVVTDPGVTLYVHGEHRVVGYRPLRAGDRVTGHCTVVGVRQTSAGIAVRTLSQCVDVDGQLVAEHHAVTMVLGRKVDESAGVNDPVATSLKGAAVEVVRTILIESDRARRYSAASGDLAVIHLDETAAREAGFPGTILHGMCTLALCGSVVADELGATPADVTELSARFVAPVPVGTDLDILISRTAADAARFRAQASGISTLERGSVRWTRSQP